MLVKRLEHARKVKLNFYVRNFTLTLVRLFGNVPLIDHTLGASEYYTVEQVGPDQIYPLIISDLEDAIAVCLHR